MLNRLPVDVNPFKLVEQGRCLAGVMPLQQLPRLVEVVLAGTQDVAVTLDFTRSIGGRPMIKGHIRGNVAVGNDKNTLLAVVTQLLPYNGYPRTLNAIACLNEVIPE